MSAPIQTITSEMVKEKLVKINANKSCGPDDIHPRLLRELAEFICGPISHLMNMSLDQSVIPNDWKNANICPVFKKGSSRLPENYRPISLTCILCKMLESFIREPVMKHLLDNKLLSSKQYGFINGRSTTTQLLFYLDKCLKTVATGGVVDVIYFDFAEAFDTVPHQRLMKNIYAYGIRGKLYKWIEALLTNRKQTVKVNGVSSREATVTSGIPQGTVLGPLLFVIYINDLLDNVKSNGLLFADDTKIFKAITEKNDALSLQDDINSMDKWTHDWLLSFHPGKCHVITLGKHENIPLAYRYTISDEEIEHVFNEKDLGVYIDSDLSFIEHITNKVRVANAILGQTRRSFTHLDGATFATLYKSFVRPHLEHLQSVWSPWSKKYINLIEAVQDRGTRLVDGFGSLTYEERLRRLKLPTLTFRRLRGDMIEVFKHFTKYDRSTIAETFIPKERNTRRHKRLLHEFQARDGVYGPQRNSFYFRTAKEWNNLPAAVAEAESVNEFKNKLDEHWKNHPKKFSRNE